MIGPVDVPSTMSLDDKLKTTPNAPGVYTIRDAAGKPIYVGKAKSLRDRLRQHFRDPGSGGPITYEIICPVGQ